jgi:CheY-like chemotaxis protein
MNEPKVSSSDPGKDANALVYIVDDEPMLLELASVILAPLGYRIVCFRDPASALEAFAAAHPPPDLVITDYAMHSMNGLALLKACRRIEPGQKVLLVSGTVDESILQQSTQKPNHFLAKPYQAKELVELVQNLVKN